MSYIARVPVKGNVYLYESVGYREGDKVKSKRVMVGKVCPKTGRDIYKPEYIERMKLAGTPVVIDEDVPQFSVNDIKAAVVKDFGLTDLLGKLAVESGLMESLRVSNPKYAAEIFTIAEYLVATGDPFMHCKDWLENNEITEDVGKLSSQDISGILADLSPNDSEGFYQAWAKKRIESEYLAIDITSASSYSELIGDVEWGYNRDGEKLPQVNLCLLMGQTSGLPVYETTYRGSLKDVSTLQTTLSKFNAIADINSICAVMDKGFYSSKNVDQMLENGQKFVIAMPFSNSFAKTQVAELRNKIDKFENHIVVGADSMKAVTKRRKWGSKFVYAHVYYSPIKAVTDREKVYTDVMQMYENALIEPLKYLDSKYINIEENETEYLVSINESAVKEAKKHSGWLVVISNHVKNAVEALLIYRQKDVVEKGFCKLKNSLDLGRLRVHSDNAMNSKIFICFLALILMCSIHNVMHEKNLYKNYTMKELLRVLAKRRTFTIGDVKITSPLSKASREIYSAFGFE